MPQNKLNFEEISFKIIAYSGEAKSLALEAINYAKEKDFDTAMTKLAEADTRIAEAGEAHMDVISEEADGVKICAPVLFIHAEDQLLNTQTIMILAKEFIEMYKLFFTNKK
ncbi:PTS lactose/cellobiose transporter subunit IIA [Spiroplasma endosymbiont of Crioceris asparagi]|uniref:PTS lactose/cellobiose transporter subunit IIA n=1 Tax=Spiroplasma endosymbiont of Crioceris asparagi TaxID=3066286 RepID=UPI0030CC9530